MLRNQSNHSCIENVLDTENVSPETKKDKKVNKIISTGTLATKTEKVLNHGVSDDNESMLSTQEEGLEDIRRNNSKPC